MTMRGVPSSEDSIKVTDDTFIDYLLLDQLIESTLEDLRELVGKRNKLTKALQIYLPAVVNHQGNTVLLERRHSKDGEAFINIINIRRVVP
jgi:hypothetical protein